MRRAFQRWGFGAIAISPLALVYGCSLAVDVDGLTGGASNVPLEAGGADRTIEAGAASDGDADASSGDDDAPFGDAPSEAEAESGTSADANDAGVHDAAESGVDASKCSGDLSNVGAGDFHVIFALTTTQNALAPILNQRDACSPAVFWDIRQNGANLQVEVDDKTNFNQVTSSGAALNDGQLHVVLVARVSGTLTIQIDGTNRGSGGSDAVLSALPSLAIGNDVCVGHDGTVPFTGSLSAICVTNL